MRPPAAAWGARDPAPLARGTWRAGDLVLKPLDMPEPALRWQAEALAGVAAEGFRLAVPLHSRGGDLVVDGWTAWPYLEGEHAPRWSEIVEAGERLHRALAGIPRPDAVLDARSDGWAVADRMAWEELPVPPDLRDLCAVRRPVGARAQLIHGDLGGNVLFAPGAPPAIIDFSPYWRPPEYASALVRVDAVLWHAAPLALLDAADPQMLLRALLFRLLAARDPQALRASSAAAIALVRAIAAG